MPQSLIGSCVGFQNLAGQQAAERDLGRGDQAQVAVGDAVDLRFRAAGNVAGALQDLVAGQVGRDRRREALLHQHVERVALQGQFQQHGLVLEEVEAVAGDLGAAFEVDQIELLGQLDVIERLEVELAAARACRGGLPGSPDRPRRAGRRDATGWESLRRIASASARSASSSACSCAWLCSRSVRPSSLRASRSAASLALPIDLLTSLAWRLSSSTSACLGAAFRLQVGKAMHVGPRLQGKRAGVR